MKGNEGPVRVANGDCPNQHGSDPLAAVEALAATTRYHRGEEIYGPDDPAKHWYRVVFGMARKCAVTADGRRQIVDFLLPGDFFGLIVRHEHQFAVEAVVEGTVIARYPRRRIEMLADSDARVGRRIREIAFEAISRSQARMVILGRMTAQEKVGAFLIELAERSRERSADGVVLAMSRYDIADYLALAAETVSRTLSELGQSGAIWQPRRPSEGRRADRCRRRSSGPPRVNRGVTDIAVPPPLSAGYRSGQASNR